MTISANGFHFSDGNSKMQKVSSYSVMPILTCAKDIPCGPDCYACKIMRIRPNVKKCYQENTDLLMKEGKYAELIEDTIAYINANKIRLFRWNVAGDFFSTRYLNAIIEIAKQCPTVTFWAFTKQFKILSDTLKKHESLPSNLNIILSAWGTFMPPKDLMKKFGVCYVHDKAGLFKIPEDAFLCQGNCEHCLTCAHLGAGESVVIHQH